MLDRYTGSAFTDVASVKRWAGTWLDATFVRRWNGSSWVDVWPLVRVSDRTVPHLAFSATATAGIRFNSSGTLQTRAGASYTDVSGEWLLSGSAGDYSVRATTVSNDAGDTSSGTMGSFLNLGTAREWYRTNTVAGDKTWVIDFEIRRDSDSAIVATGRITLQPTVE